MQEGGQMIQLPLHVGVPEGLIAFASAPEHVARAVQFLGDFEGLLDLGGGESEPVGGATGGRAVDVARMAEQVGGAPEQLDARAVHLTANGVHHGVEVFVRHGQVVALGREVAVMEAKEIDPELLDALEGDLDAMLGVRERIIAAFPRALHRRRAERVEARAAHRVPIGDAEAEMLAHRRPSTSSPAS